MVNNLQVDKIRFYYINIFVQRGVYYILVKSKKYFFPFEKFFYVDTESIYPKQNN